MVSTRTPKSRPHVPLSGGPAMRMAIRVARARAGITSDTQLALRAGVHYDTLMNWYGGRTVPRPHEVKKVADVLGVSYGSLLAAYDGVDPEPPPLADAIRELVEELRLQQAQQHEATMALLRAVAAVVGPGREPPGTPADSESGTPAGTDRR